MHCLEHILLVTSVAVEKDEISKAELVRALRTLASASHSYIPEGHNEEELQPMNNARGLAWLRYRRVPASLAPEETKIVSCCNPVARILDPHGSSNF
jgi:hypothetical protein